jgi:hypothetical protein
MPLGKYMPMKKKFPPLLKDRLHLKGILDKNLTNLKFENC